MMRRSVVVLTLPFPVQPGSGRKRGVEEPYVEHITTVHSKDFMQTTEKFDGTTRRGELYTTKSRDESVVMDTYITQDGGRIDWLRQQWPPAVLHVKEATLEDVRVKHGVPWPSLYPALDAHTESVTLRYVMDSAHPKLRTLKTRHCALCIDQTDGLFKPLSADEEAKAFARRCIYAPVPDWQYQAYLFLTSMGVYRYAAAAMTRVSKVFLFSKEQVVDLLTTDYHGGFGSCLDIGAGSGDVSTKFQEHFESYTATEVSSALIRALRRNGIRDAVCTDVVNDRKLKQPAGTQFDVVLCLNVLDRCSSITRMLDDMIRAVKPGGRLILSVPLPLRQAQHRLGKAQEMVWPPSTNEPGAWEFAAGWFAGYVLDRYGGAPLKLKRIARAPYMANGAARAPLSVLDAAVFVFDKTEDALHAESPVTKEWSGHHDVLIV